MKKKILFIVNPISGTGKQQLLEQVLKEHLHLDQFEYQIVFTEYRGHATSLAQKAISDFDIITAVGGDGTVNEVAKGLANSNRVMAILPVGSGNGLARHLKLSMRLSEAVQTINESKVKSIDMGSVNGYRFINVAGVGFDAHIAHLYAKTERRGPIPYAKLMTNEFHRYKPQTYDVFIEGQPYHLSAFLISFANSSQFGNNAYISPHATINDGLIDVCMMSAFPKVEAGQMAVKLFNKRMDKSRFMKIVRGTEIVVKTSSPMKGHIDGEPVNFPDSIVIKVIPNALNIIYNHKVNRLRFPPLIPQELANLKIRSPFNWPVG